MLTFVFSFNEHMSHDLFFLRASNTVKHVSAKKACFSRKDMLQQERYASAEKACFSEKGKRITESTAVK
jgi:hypothetical protein